jgi:hypothetical protein
MDPIRDPITYKGCVYPWQCDQIGHMNIMWYVGTVKKCPHLLDFFAFVGADMVPKRYLPTESVPVRRSQISAARL